jgi:hypothetical protein
MLNRFKPKLNSPDSFSDLDCEIQIQTEYFQMFLYWMVWKVNGDLFIGSQVQEFSF